MFITNIEPFNLDTAASYTFGNVSVTGVVSATGNVTGQYIVGNGSQITGVSASSVNAANLTGNTMAAGVVNSSLTSVGTLTSLNSGAISSSGNVTGANFLTGGLISATGNVSANNISGTLTTAAQPNITSVGTLTSLNSGAISSSGNVTGTNILTGGLVSAAGNVTAGNLSGTNITGTLTTAAQPNITSVGTLTLLNSGAISSSGNVTGANFLTGGLISALGNVTAGNLSGTNITGTLTTAAQPNITSVGTLTSLNSGAISSSGNVTGTNILTGGLVSSAGNVYASYVVANIIGNIESATVSATGNVTGGNLLTGGIISSLGNITGGNLSGTNVTGTLTTAAQPNVTSVGTLTSLNSGAISSSGNVTGTNILTGGLVSATGNVIANNISGTLTTAAQPNITSVGTLTSLNSGAISSSGNITGGNLLTGGIVSTGGNIFSAGWIQGANVSTGGNVLVDGYISVTGNLYVANVVSSSNLVVQDPLVYLTANSTYPYNYDIGLYSQFTGGAGNTYQHTGLVRDYTDGVWKFFSNVPEPSGTVINFADAIYDPIKTGNISAASSTLSGLLSAQGNITGGNLLTGGLVSASSNVTGGNLITGGLTSTANLSISGQVTGSLVPSANVTYDLGSSANKWRDLYLSGNSIYLGTQTVTSNVTYVSTAANFSANNIVGGSLSTGGSLSLSGGTANGVVYLNTSKVATSGAALVFDGNNLGLGITSPSLYLDLATFYSYGSARNGTIRIQDFSTPAIAAYIDRIGSLGLWDASYYYGGGLRTANDTYSSGVSINNGGVTFFGNTGLTPGATFTATERMRLDSNGRLGLGVTPSTWGSSYGPLQNVSGFFSSDGNGSNYTTIIGNNAYYDTNDNRWEYYRSSSGASLYRLNNSNGNPEHAWHIAASGTANAAITWTQAMTLNANGNLGIGTTGPSTRLDVRGSMYVPAAGFKAVGSLYSTDSQGAGNGAGLELGGVFTGTSVTAFAQIAGIKENSTDGNYAGALTFYSRPNGDTLYERMRIDSAGNLGLGITPTTGWDTVTPVFQIGGGASIYGYGSEIRVNANYYYNSGDKYIGNGYATSYNQASGQHKWYTAGNNTSGAGATITFAQVMTLTATGDLVVGGTSASAASATTLYSDGTIVSILGSGVGGQSIFGAITGVNNGYEINVTAGNATTYKWNTTVGQVMTLDNNGNLGLGVTPDTNWPSGWKVLQMGAVAAISSSDNFMLLASNAYWDGTNYRRIAANYASRYLQANGQHYWEIAGSSSANSTISFSTAMTINSSGLIGLATTNFTYTANDNVPVVGTTTNNQVFISGSLQLIGNDDAIVFGRGTASFLKDEELGFGWGSGWYQTDTTYLRVRNAVSNSVQLLTGTIVPVSTGTYNLGSTSARWANIYTSDLSLSNEHNPKGNDVNGTTGSWTIQEGDEDLFLINNKNGKKYKFALVELTEGV